MNYPFESIAHCVSHHALSHPSHDAIIFLERGETETERLSYAELDARAASYAAGFAAEGLAGRAVAIAMPPGAAFVALFLGCLRAGAIAMPVPFPDSDRSMQRISSILADARPAAIFSDKSAVSKLQAIAPAISVLDHERLMGTALEAPVVTANHPALIQYTSGSTQTPKGIVITQANLMANERMIQRAFDLPVRAIGVTWLPHFHDMGLIGTILQPLFLGGTAIMMPPRAFIQKPLRWLRAIERYGAHTAGAPSFGYELCFRMVRSGDTATLDLSSWQVAFCGAEPVRAEVLQQFAQRFGAAGFSENAFLPCYGLAETTLITAASAPHKGLKLRKIAPGGGTPRNFVSCGKPVEGSTLLLRDESGKTASSGEICVGGPHVSPGIWNGQDERVAPFDDLVTENGLSYLRTGDIGTLVDGELFVIDRLKDVLVLYGAKIHAVDVEATALEHNADVRAAAAFAIDNGQREHLIVLCEIDRRRLAEFEPAITSSAIAKRIADAHGVVPTVQLVAYGQLPRTSSGKIQRFAARTNFLSGAWGVPNVLSGAEASPTHE